MSYAGYTQSMGLPQTNVSNEIRQEIQRFESVHPSIYAIYDLIEGITDPFLQSQIREHVVCIEDSFVNSQEWTSSRAVPELKLGIVGFVQSGKSALVHRYLTGSYMHEESPEGGRFKKEVQIDGQSYLLLIRDEGGFPEPQFTNWIDVVIFVFSLENEMSFNAVSSYYNKMCHHRDITQLPIILVGTQDAISASNPRVVEEARAKKLETELGRCCRYYETCATYGLNVEIVFQDACQKAVQERARMLYAMLGRVNGSMSNLKSHGGYANPRIVFQQPSNPLAPSVNSTPKSTRSSTPPDSQSGSLLREHSSGSVQRLDRQQRASSTSSSYSTPGVPEMSPPMLHAMGPPTQLPIQSKAVQPQQCSPVDRPQQLSDLRQQLEDQQEVKSPLLTPVVKRRGKKLSSVSLRKSNSFHGVVEKRNTTPNSTPVLSRKSTRKQSQAPRKEEGKTDELGSGRSIPLKQGYLYKKGGKGLTKDWKKKYVTLTDTGKLIYHPNMRDYMENTHGKEITIMHTTVKIPGQSKPRLATQLSNGSGADYAGADLMMSGRRHSPSDSLSSLSNSSSLIPASNDDIANIVAGLQAARIDSLTPHVKRRHRRAKSGSKIEANGDGTDSDGYEFIIVSLDNKQWHFEAPSLQDRDSWVSSIEKQILHSLQGMDSQKKAVQDPNAVLAIRNMPGNNFCCDCGAPNPSWASLNLGSLICIECSGIHRNLGTHLSRVRSLELDEWPPDLVGVMLAIGNQRSNSIWEAKLGKHKKPTPFSSREEKEQFIRAKYESKDFIPNRTHQHIPLNHLLIDAIARQELIQSILLLADSTPEEVSCPYSNSDRRTPLHIAAQQGNAIFLQLLLWNGADVNKVDQEGRSALWYARQVDAKDCAAILVSNGCTEQATLSRPRRGSLMHQYSVERHSINSLH